MGKHGTYPQEVYQERKVKQYILAIVGIEKGEISVGTCRLQRLCEGGKTWFRVLKIG